MTVAMLMENTLKSAERIWDESHTFKLKPLPLNILEKVPTDIKISLAQTPKPITQLAEEIGVLPNSKYSWLCALLPPLASSIARILLAFHL